MRIVYLAAGAGQMYCGACARDIVLVRGLLARGHDVQVIPLYTPLRIEGDKPFPTDTVYIGGINAYLQQRFALFRRMPRFVDRLLDSPSLLKLVSRFAISTEASELGEMTVSVLAGREGLQSKELRRLVEHLKSEGSPDLFVITNSLLSGIAPELRRHFPAPVLCGLQGEDGFVNSMREPHRSKAQGLMRRNAQSIDLFLSPSESYARTMSEYLEVPRERVRVVRSGLATAQYRREGPRPRDPFVVGYLSVITPGKGLDLLVDACGVLVQQGRDLKLRVVGRVLDKDYWKQVERKARSTLRGRFEWLGEVELEDKIRFLHQCSMFCVPSRFSETRGMAVMEAIAAGVPVVAPSWGVYPELLKAVGGGVLVRPEDSAALAEAIARLMDDPEEADRLGREGAQAIETHHGAQSAVEDMLKVLEEVKPGD